MKDRVRAIAITSLVAAATLLSPARGFAQGRRPASVVRGVRPVRVIRPAVVIGAYYRPWFYDPFYFDPFYFDPYYRWYPPAYRYGAVLEREASLRLEVTPREAEVFVDGYYAGQAKDFDGFLKRLRLPPGEHDLQLYLPGYRLVQQKVYLQPGATFRVRYNLEPLAPGEPAPERPKAMSPPSAAATPRDNSPTSETGTLALRVQPGDAIVLIDGERWEGSRDAERLIVQLPPGVHRVEIRKEGYRPYSSDVTVRRGETEPLNVALAR